MQRKKLEKLKRELARLRRSPQKASELEGFAKQLGRQLANRGKHPMWVSADFKELFPLSIPHHNGDVPIGTRLSILDQLEDDIIAWEERVSTEEAELKTDDDSGEENDAG